MSTSVTEPPQVTVGGGPNPMVPTVAAPGIAAGPGGPVAPVARPTKPGPRGPLPWYAALGTGLSFLAVAVLTFVGYVMVLSAVEHARAQRISYAELREQLSAGTAPTGQTDSDGKWLALGDPVALLTIPTIGMEREVVGEGTTSDVLAKGPGHRRSSALPGQPGVAIVYGRRWAYGAPFGALPDLVPGDLVKATTGQGESTYEVTGVRRKGDPIPAPPADGQGRLTLVTATGRPFAPNGVMYVDAKLTSTPFEAPARPLTSAWLPARENAMGTDPSAWLGIALLGQALAVATLGATWLRRRWTFAQTWLVGFPVVGMLLVFMARTVTQLLPNLV